MTASLRSREGERRQDQRDQDQDEYENLDEDLELLGGARDHGRQGVDWLLRFQPLSLEAAFQFHTSRRRILSTYRVDYAIFVGLALFMACGWPRVYNKGHPQEMPYMLLSGIFYTVCACTYTSRAKPGSILELVQIKFRLPLQILCYTLSTVLFSRHIGLDNMGLCSPFNPEFSSFEALVIYLLWMASYPTLASIPFKYCTILQPFLFVFVQVPSSRQCLMGGECTKTDDMYDLYASTVAWSLSSMVPLTAGEATKTVQSDPSRHCLAMMFYWKLLIVVFLSWYVTYFFEVRVRRVYVVECRKGPELLEIINAKRVGGAQAIIEILLCMCLTWVITQLVV